MVDERVRPMTLSDYDRVHALWMSCQNMGLNDLDDSREGIGRYLRRNPTTCFVAEAGDALAGAILAGHDGRRGYIYHLAVAEEYRRKGWWRSSITTPETPFGRDRALTSGRI